MKKVWTGILAVAMVLGMAVTSFAATYDTPADIVAGITGKSIDSVVALRQGGKTYGTIAAEAGKLDEFKQAALQLKEERLEQLVENGSITQDDADEMLALIKEQQAICNGTGNAGGGRGLGLGTRSGTGIGAGYGHHGGGRGMGTGGMRLQDGSCR